MRGAQCLGRWLNGANVFVGLYSQQLNERDNICTTKMAFFGFSYTTIDIHRHCLFSDAKYSSNPYRLNQRIGFFLAKAVSLSSFAVKTAKHG